MHELLKVALLIHPIGKYLINFWTLLYCFKSDEAKCASNKAVLIVETFDKEETSHVLFLLQRIHNTKMAIF